MKIICPPSRAGIGSRFIKKRAMLISERNWKKLITPYSKLFENPSFAIFTHHICYPDRSGYCIIYINTAESSLNPFIDRNRVLNDSAVPFLNEPINEYSGDLNEVILKIKPGSVIPWSLYENISFASFISLSLLNFYIEVVWFFIKQFIKIHLI